MPLKVYIALLITVLALQLSCSQNHNKNAAAGSNRLNTDTLMPDFNSLPDGELKEMVKYGYELMVNTAYYIGPNGIKGKHLGNKMNCTNCHQNAGTKNYSFSLIHSHNEYPQYRAREDRVLTLSDRVNNCINRPHNGKEISYTSKEMTAFLSYFKFLSDWAEANNIKHEKVINIALSTEAADYKQGEKLYMQHCASCHKPDGSGQMRADSVCYEYPPLWGNFAYQAGSSMHRVIKLAQWIKANMPYKIATAEKPFLTDKEAYDIAAFINNDSLHSRPTQALVDYPNPLTKPIDYGVGPFADNFSAYQHKFGPHKPIYDYWVKHNLKPRY